MHSLLCYCAVVAAAVGDSTLVAFGEVPVVGVVMVGVVSGLLTGGVVTAPARSRIDDGGFLSTIRGKTTIK
jgi:hypothetical protein